MWCQHGCHSGNEQEVYNAVRTTHCATETIDRNGDFKGGGGGNRQTNTHSRINGLGDGVRWLIGGLEEGERGRGRRGRINRL